MDYKTAIKAYNLKEDQTSKKQKNIFNKVFTNKLKVNNFIYCICVDFMDQTPFLTIQKFNTNKIITLKNGATRYACNTKIKKLVL